MTKLFSESLNSDLPLASLIVRWHTHLAQEKRYSPYTVRNYYKDICTFVDFLTQHYGHDVSVEDFVRLTRRDLRAFFSMRQGENVSMRTNAATLSSLRNFAHFLKKQDIAATDVFHAYEMRQQRTRLPKAVGEIDLRAFLEAVEELTHHKTREVYPWVRPRDRALMLLLYGGGLRISEALALDLGALCSLEQQNLLVEGKGQKARQVPILPVVTHALRVWAAAHPNRNVDPKTAPLFVGIRGGRLAASVVQANVRTLRRLLNLPEHLTPHALRHSFATHMLASGADLKTIQDLLGHAHLSTTQIYTSVADAHLQRTYVAAHPRAKK